MNIEDTMLEDKKREADSLKNVPYKNKKVKYITEQQTKLTTAFKDAIKNNDDAIQKLQINIKDNDIEEWVKRTEGMSLSHLKEVLVSVIVMGRTFEETISNLEGLKIKPTVKTTSKVGFGK